MHIGPNPAPERWRSIHDPETWVTKWIHHSSAHWPLKQRRRHLLCHFPARRLIARSSPRSPMTLLAVLFPGSSHRPLAACQCEHLVRSALRHIDVHPCSLDGGGVLPIPRLDFFLHTLAYIRRRRRQQHLGPPSWPNAHLWRVCRVRSSGLSERHRYGYVVRIMGYANSSLTVVQDLYSLANIQLENIRLYLCDNSKLPQIAQRSPYRHGRSAPWIRGDDVPGPSDRR